MLGVLNLELQLPIETVGQASQLDIPTRPDRTEANLYSNSPSNSDTENPNLYPGHYPTARTNPNGCIHCFFEFESG